MNEICGCCEGIHKLTPVARLNRPGLSALAYRVGTHASFLETMKARLSNMELEPEVFETDETTNRAPVRPLLKLTTRAASDPSIALLDAWATVADVLTFYQERIANEGFLLTATERRSILELARLVGYRLRPGVAASVFLAYTLEKNTEVEIPAGARAASVPGPGELPQTFETSDKLYARSEWNKLAVRRTRPQRVSLAPGRIENDKTSIYFKSTTTKLKPNDPLLLVSGSSNQRLLRVLAVEPDQTNARTKVSLEPWQTVRAVRRNFIIEVRKVIDRHTEGKGFEVNTDTATARRVITHLNELNSKVESSQTDEDLREMVDASLEPLREEHRLAVEGNFTKLHPWIGSIVSELEPISNELAAAKLKPSDSRGAETFTSFEDPIELAGSQSPSPAESSLGDVLRIVDDLDKSASQPPSSSVRLPRSVADSFSTASDSLPKLVVAMRPALRDLLYRAWENLPVSAPLPVSIYALRTRAAVFGHNAPLKPITNKDTGRVDGYEEWTLFRDQRQAPNQRFTITVAFPRNESSFTCTVALVDQAGRQLGTVTRNGALTDGPQRLNISNVNEIVILTVSDAPANRNQAKFTFTFEARQFDVVINWNLEPGIVSASSTNNNLVKVEHVRESGAITSVGRGESLTTDGSITFAVTPTPTEEPTKVSLDASFNEIVPGGWAVLERPSLPPLITGIVSVRDVSRADYGLTFASTQLELTKPWIDPAKDQFDSIRGTNVFAQSELLELAEEPIDEPVCGGRLELSGLVSGLEPGRWLIVSGERTDIAHAPPGGTAARGATPSGTENEIVVSTAPNVAAAEKKEALPGVTSSELVMLAGIEQSYNRLLPGDKTHTTLILSEDLAFCYKRETISVYGNVVKATHGETKKEVLGSGDGSRELQQFALRQAPLTYLAAATPAGAESTLEVRVNDLLWHETDNLVGLGPKDRRYTISIDDKDQTTVGFGNGKYGARLPTGVENVKAVYRAGIGKPGNVKAGRITSVVTKPLGVKEVTNPLPASGGADREDRDQARRNVPIAVMSLDRLVSVQDYEDFARTYAGIAKASSARLSDGRRTLIHLTIAGADDIPIATTSDLFLNLRKALGQFGDPFQNIQVVSRKLKLLVITAKVRLQPDYSWEFVEPKIRQAVIDNFSFARRELGQDALASEALSVIQAQKGVAYVDLDRFDAIAEDASSEELARLGTSLTLQMRIVVNKAKIDKTATDPAKRILPAELAYLNPIVADTLILTELSE